MRSSQVEESEKGSIIKDDNMVHATTQLQTIAATYMGMVPRTERTSAGKNIEKWRENKMNGKSGTMGLLGLDTSEQKMGYEQGIGMNHNIGQNARARKKKWKFQARERAMTGKSGVGPASLKRAMMDQIRLSSECKKIKLGSFPTAKLKLVWGEEVHVLIQNEGMDAENVSVEARK